MEVNIIIERIHAFVHAIALVLVNFVTPNFFLIFSILLHCLPTQSINTESLLKAIYLCKLFSALMKESTQTAHNN